MVTRPKDTMWTEAGPGTESQPGILTAAAALAAKPQTIQAGTEAIKRVEETINRGEKTIKEERTAKMGIPEIMERRAAKIHGKA